MKKDQFLANTTNKQRFITLLSNCHLQEVNCQTYHATGDADLLIVQKSVESAITTTTVLIGDDTGLIILLIYHTNLESHDIFFKPEPKNTTKIPRVWDMKAVKKQFRTWYLYSHPLPTCYPRLRHYFPPLWHREGSCPQAISHQQKFSCASQGIWHRVSIHKRCRNGRRECSGVFLQMVTIGRTSTRSDISVYVKKAATSTSHVQPQSLPPTSSAAKYHSLRVYYQIQEWKGIADKIRPEEWGWIKMKELVHVQTDLAPAPEELLRVIRCNCQADCSSLRCTCKKHGMLVLGSMWELQRGRMHQFHSDWIRRRNFVWTIRRFHDLRFSISFIPVEYFS